MSDKNTIYEAIPLSFSIISTGAFVLFCPVGLLIAGVSCQLLDTHMGTALMALDHNRFHYIWIAINLLILGRIYFASQLSPREFLKKRMSWIQITYFLCGVVYYQPTHDSTSSLGRDAFMLLMIILSFALEGFLSAKFLRKNRLKK